MSGQAEPDLWRAFGSSEKRRWWTMLPDGRSDGANRRLRESADPGCL